MPAKVTVKTLARELGISHMTVSRAINDHPNVSVDMRERVLKLALDRGYIQSSAAKALRGMKSGTIGLLLPNIVNDFYARFAQAFGDLCAARRLNLVIHLTSEDPERERQALEQLRGLHADAAIIVPTLADEGRAAETSGETIRRLYLIRSPAVPRPAQFVGIDDTAAIDEAVAHLVQHGHRLIAFIGPSLALSSGRGRREAFARAMAAAGLSPSDERTLSGPAVYDHGRDSVRKCLALEVPPTAILCAGVEIARGALEQLLENDVLLGEQLAFIGYGDPAVYRWLNGGVSTIGLPTEALARSTFELALSDDTTTEAAIQHRARLIIRRSSGPTEPSHVPRAASAVS
ncbi:LacI family DNA-binding transcriptional regulator [Sphingomonas sp.]|uniref:LacI family DNA-binding transcriptional regulator n=1 Tax=Sphingomonas sp. TaxID=28214 RepID=UPI003BAA8634